LAARAARSGVWYCRALALVDASAHPHGAASTHRNVTANYILPWKGRVYVLALLREAAGEAADILSASTVHSCVSSSFPRVREGAVIEAFPNAFLGVCLENEIYAAMPKLRRGQKFSWLYDQWKQNALVGSLPSLTSNEKTILEGGFAETSHHEHQAALVCILTARLTARNHFTAVGDPKSGWFFLPPWECWKNWARRCYCCYSRLEQEWRVAPIGPGWDRCLDQDFPSLFRSALRPRRAGLDPYEIETAFNAEAGFGRSPKERKAQATSIMASPRRSRPRKKIRLT
jgi:hypothetical protein